MVGLLDFFTGGDPAEMAQIDPRYGVARSDVRDAAINTLGNLSATLLAAGQPISGAQRAQYLSQIGQAGAGFNTDLYNAAQRRLMTAQMDQRRAEAEETRQIQELMKNPEAFRAQTGFDLQQFGGMRAGDVSQALKQIRTQRLGRDPQEEQLRGLQIQEAQRKLDEPRTVEAGGALHQYNPQTRRWERVTDPRPQGGLEGEAQALILQAMRNPEIANTPDYAIAYNRAFGPRMVSAYNPTTQQMEYQWASPPIPQGVPQPRYSASPAAPGGEAGAPAGAMPPPGGATPLISQRPQEDRPLTEAQAKATGFAARMIQAARIIDPLDLTDAAKPGMLETGLGSRLPEFAANAMRSADRQRYRQAQENWVRANLRMESGAVIGADEMQKEIQNYFPQPLDGPEVIEQKRRAREAATLAMVTSAGPGAQRAGLEFRPYEPSMADRIRSATAQDLLQMDTSQMNAREKAEYAARLRQLNRGR